MSFFIRFHKSVRERVVGQFGRGLTHLKAEGNKKSQEPYIHAASGVRTKNSVWVQAANNVLDGLVNVIGKFVK